MQVLVKQLQVLKERGEFFSTVYLGGGTPSVLDEDILEILLKELSFFFKKSHENTVEINPESWSKSKAELFKDSGINRLSLGVQSLNNKKLQFLGRIHSAKQSLETILSMHKFGFRNIGVDLIFDTPLDTWESFLKELEIITSLPITHISCYGLSYEENTLLYKQMFEKKLVLEQDPFALVYNKTVSFLKTKGYLQYEISNFSKRGFKCRHNLNYWRNIPYVGLGPSAVSFCDYQRLKNVSSIDKYIELVLNNEQVFSESEKLSPLRRACEYAAVAIRNISGINFDKFKESMGLDLRKIRKHQIEDLVSKRLISYKKRKNIYGIKLTRRGVLFCDLVSQEFIL